MALTVLDSGLLRSTSSSDPRSITIPVHASAIGVLVFAFADVGTTGAQHATTGMTLGGETPTATLNALDTATEPGQTLGMFWSGTEMPASGDQTLSIDLTTSTTNEYIYVYVNIGGDAGETAVEVITSGLRQENVANPSIALSYGGVSGRAFAGLYSGAVATSVTPGADTTQAQEGNFDSANRSASVIYQTTPGTADFTIGWTVNDDTAAAAWALKGVTGGASATGTVTLPAAIVSGTAETTYAATGAVTLVSLSVTGTGEQSVTSTGAVLLAPVTASGTGDFGYAATGAVTLPALTATGTGTETYTATGAVSLPAATVTGAGEAVQPLTATGAVTVASLAVTGTAEQTNVGQGAVTLYAPTMDGTAAVAFSGSGAITLPSVAASGTGETLPVLTATGAIVVGGVVIEGTGDNGAYVPVIPPMGRRRRPVQKQPEPEPIPLPPLIGSGAISLAGLAVHGQGRSEYDDIWLYIEPALYLAGAVK